MMINTKSEALIVKQIQDNEAIFNRDLKWLERITSIENVDVDSLDLSLPCKAPKLRKAASTKGSSRLVSTRRIWRRIDQTCKEQRES